MSVKSYSYKETSALMSPPGLLHPEVGHSRCRHRQPLGSRSKQYANRAYLTSGDPCGKSSFRFRFHADCNEIVFGFIPSHLDQRLVKFTCMLKNNLLAHEEG